jgi:hypothetical protein
LLELTKKFTEKKNEEKETIKNDVMKQCERDKDELER